LEQAQKRHMTQYKYSTPCNTQPIKLVAVR